MGISPFYVNQTLPILSVTLKDDSGNPLNLTGGTLSGVLRNLGTGLDTTLTGTWTIISATAGTCSYTWASADTVNAGNFNLLIAITYSGSPEYADPIPLLILNR